MRKLILLILLLSGWSFADENVIKQPVSEDVWINMGGVPGLDGRVSSIAIHGNNIYVAGIFTSIDTHLEQNQDYGDGLVTVAGWNGKEWLALAKYGNCGDVRTLAVAPDGSLYAGGVFCINGTSVNQIGRWNGKKWEPVGEGIAGEVHALYFDEKGILYATGNSFRDNKSDGEIVGGFVMKWDGVAWSKLGAGILKGNSGGGMSLRGDHQGNIYVVGSFDSIGDVKAHNVAMWNGKKWQAIGSGVGGEVTDENNGVSTAMSVAANSKGTLYVVSSLGLEKWNGKKWEVVDIKTVAVANTLFIDKEDHVYVGLVSTCNVEGGPSVGTEYPIQYWDGVTWRSFALRGSNSGSAPGCTNGASVTKFAEDDIGNLYVGGAFAESSSGAKNIAKWNGKTWESLGSNFGVNDSVEEIVVDKEDNLYVRGKFTRVDNIPVAKNQLAKWHNGTWSVLQAVELPIRRMASDDVGGLYIATGDNQKGTSIISRWDGKIWRQITMIGYLVSAFLVDDEGKIFTCGITGDESDHYGVLEYHGIDMWDGKVWTRLPETSFKADYQCGLKQIERKILHVQSHSGVWRWNGESWSMESGKNLIAAVAKDAQGGLYSINRENYNEGRNIISTWQSDNWNVLGATSIGNIDSMVATKEYLYIGGTFSWINRNPNPYLARLKINRTKSGGSLEKH